MLPCLLPTVPSATGGARPAGKTRPDLPKLSSGDAAFQQMEWQASSQHCSDFRTSFMRIGGLRALTDAPFMALSASAPLSIALAIEESLHLKAPVKISHGLDKVQCGCDWSGDYHC